MTELLQEVLEVALRAGAAILEVCARDYSVELKADRSPLTEADRAAHAIICAALRRTRWPVLSEESSGITDAERRSWTTYWLVDPLDGTKEFIRKGRDYTVNIALVEAGRPILGVVYAPALQTVYCADATGAYKAVDCGEKPVFEIVSSARRLPLDRPAGPLRVVASRSHRNAQTQAFVETLQREHGDLELVCCGSSLKLCWVAEGAADLYPRLAPTMEWDTAAAQAVVEAAGARVLQYGTDEPLRYNKENLLNPFFVAKR